MLQRRAPPRRDSSSRERHQRLLLDHLRADRHESRVHDLDDVDVALEEQLGRRRTDPARVLVRRSLGEPVERGVDAVLAVAEVALGLPSDEDERVVDPARALLLDRVLGGADHRRVVRAAQPAVGGDDDVPDLADVGPRGEEQAVARAAADGEVVDDLGDRLAVRLRGGDVRPARGRSGSPRSAPARA